jgi:hypothetical protein
LWIRNFLSGWIRFFKTKNLYSLCSFQLKSGQKFVLDFI